MSSTNNVDTAGTERSNSIHQRTVPMMETSTTEYGTIPIDATAIVDDGNLKSLYNLSNVVIEANQSNTDVKRLLPELFVMEIHRDGNYNNAVSYRHLTLRGLYQYVLDAIADRTGVLQAAAYAQLWRKKTKIIHNNNNSAFQQKQEQEQQQQQQQQHDCPMLANTYSVNTGNAIVVIEPQQRPPFDALYGSPLNTTSDTLPIHPETNTVPPSTVNQPLPSKQPALNTNFTTTTSTTSSPHHVKTTINSASNIEGQSNSNNYHNHICNNVVTYRERLGGYIHPRDMRRLITPFSTSNEPEIIVRRHVILINYDPLRTIVLRDRLLVLVPQHESGATDTLLSKLQSCLFGTKSGEGMKNEIFDTTMNQTDTSYATVLNTPKSTSATSGKVKKSQTLDVNHSSSSCENCSIDSPDTKVHVIDQVNDIENNYNNDDNTTDEWYEMKTREWIHLPFELQCTDAVLSVVGSILHKETMDVQQTAESFMERIVKHGGSGFQEDDPLTILRSVKDDVQLMSNRVKSYVQSIHRLLDNDKDMALMNLSRLLSHPERFVHPVPQRILNEESDEPEIILESNLQVGLALVNYLDVIQSQIHTSKELIDQRLDATRNKLLFANMLISVFTLCVTLGALVGSFFGMNLELPNDLANDDFAFNRVVAYTCLGCIVICAFIMIVLLYTDTIQFRLSRPFRPVRINV